MKKSITLVLLCITLIVSFCACSSTDGQAQQTRVWKFAHAGNNGDALDVYAQKFKELVESEFDDVTVQLFPAAQLGSDDERFELVKGSGAEFAMVATAFIGNVLPEAQVFGISYMVPENRTAAAKVFSEGNAVKEINALMEGQGIKGMDWYYEDFSCLTSNKPVRSLSDLRGQKIRCMNSFVDIANVEAMGANATPMTFSEVYSALQIGTIDGQQNPIGIIESQKFYEVQKYLTLTNHETVVDVIISNKDFYDGLPAEDQEKLQKIFQEVNTFALDSQAEQTAASLKRIQDQGGTEIIELDHEALSAFKETSAASQKKFVDTAGENGQKILDLLLTDIKNFSE